MQNFLIRVNLDCCFRFAFDRKSLRKYKSERNIPMNQLWTHETKIAQKIDETIEFINEISVYPCTFGSNVNGLNEGDGSKNCTSENKNAF